MIYSGNEVKGKQVLQEALRNDPDNVEAQKALKILKTETNLKEEASEAFKSNKLNEAIQMFDRCL